MQEYPVSPLAVKISAAPVRISPDRIDSAAPSATLRNPDPAISTDSPLYRIPRSVYYKRLEEFIPFRAPSAASGPELVKTHIAVELRDRILRGELQPGGIISEIQWGQKLGVAQASVREAINLLVSEGLVRKAPGCSARVTNLTRQDVVQAYQVREVLEGLAARLLAGQNPDLSGLEQAIEAMRDAALKGDLRAAIEADLTFHLRLCELPGNIFLSQQARQLLIPVFAFTMIRALAESSPARAWVESVGDHNLILAGIRSADPLFAEQSTRHAIGKFVSVANEVWAAAPAGPRTKRPVTHAPERSKPK